MTLPQDPQPDTPEPQPTPPVEPPQEPVKEPQRPAPITAMHLRRRVAIH